MYTPAELARREVQQIPASARMAQALASAKQEQMQAGAEAQAQAQTAQANAVLKEVSEGKDVIHTVNITSKQKRYKGSDVIEYRGTTDAGGRYSNEYISGDFLVGHGDLESKALASARSKFGINETDRVYIDGRLVQESSLSPDVFKLAKDVSSGKLSYEQAQVTALHARREELKSGFGGTFTPSMQALAAAPIGADVRPIMEARVKESQQVALKKQMLEQSKTWGGVKDYEDKLAEVSRFTAVTPQKEIYVVQPGAQPPQEQPVYDPHPTFTKLRDEIVGAPLDKEGIIVPRFGLMVPRKDPAETFAKELYSKGIAPSPFTLGIAKSGMELAAEYRTIAKDPDPIFGSIRESIASSIEFVSAAPAALEIVGKTVIKDPFALPAMAVYSAVKLGEGITEQATTRPGQFASDIIVGTFLFGAGAKGIKTVGGVSESAVRGGMDIAKRVSRPTLKIIETGEPVAIPGMGIVIKKSYAVEFGKQMLEPIKGETVMAEPKTVTTLPGVIKTTPLSKQAMVIDLSKESRIGIAGRPVTKYRMGTPSQSQRSITAKLERLKSQELLKSRTVSPTIVKTEPSFTQVAAITGAMATAQRQRTRQIAGQLTGQQIKGVQLTGQLAGQQTKQVTSRIATTLQIPETQQKADTLQVYVPILDTPTIITPRQVPRTTPDLGYPAPARPTRTPPEEPILKIPLLDEEEELPGKKKKKGKKGKGDTGKGIVPDFWFPASLEAVTKEEFTLGGKRAIHIGRKEKKKTEKLYGRLIKTGRGIPTKKQFKASDLL